MRDVHPSMSLIRRPSGGWLQQVPRLATVRTAHKHLGWLVVATLALGGCTAVPGAAEPPRPQLSSLAPSPAASTAVDGAYLDFATCDPTTLHQRTATTQVYFFHQDDCPTCQATDAALLDHGVPDGFTVFKVDLPTMSELADRYGVTEPNTFVQVDKAGKKVKSWIGASDGADIAAHTTS